MGGGEGGPAVGPLNLERQIMPRLVGLQVVQVRIGPGRFHFLKSKEIVNFVPLWQNPIS